MAALISLVLVVTLIQLSQFKHGKLWMTVDFVDLMIIDRDTSAFLPTAMPTLRLPIALATVAVAALVVLAWRFDQFRVRLRVSAGGGTLCLGALMALSLPIPTILYEDFFSHNYVSKFARTGVEAIYELVTHGYMEWHAPSSERLKATPV